MAVRPRRSALYMPASNPRAVEKARALDCDVVILDLEDAVAPDVKADARAAAVAAVAAGGFGRRELVVRANGIDTPWGFDDLAALAAARPDAVLVPKVDDGAAVARHAAALAGAAPLWVMIETARSIFRLEEIAAALADAGPGGGFVLGTNDLAKEMGARPGTLRAPFQGMLGMAVAAARAHGLVVLDGVFNAIDDDAGFAEQCAQAVEFGFDGKTLIHPRQIAACNAAFTPDADAVAWARAIVAAFADPANAAKGAIRVEGRMVERLHLAQAERDLAVAEWAAAG
ncbi:HpcH/HpaI aldolase/citrate lyase family protein [Edaphosphingomonas haloaromaticamans]|uniref:(3S)-malyl-CoA thioesterase n=1 Tax=Edaphosphingomonas haloaromaticamans TaxID=653954 RepID=A0A1S1HAW7_9SPHN|nr:CoA ester lyase [Sphingomonas haloaromaticamans]OHT18786.1 (3S)-malyl-CoA thioesterase [Sphingomonas haloaromaticamans]